MINILFILLIEFSFSIDLTFSIISETYSNNQPKIIQIYSKALDPELIRVEYYYINGSLRRVENYKESTLNNLVIEYIILILLEMNNIGYIRLYKNLHS